MKRFYEVWINMGFCCWILFTFVMLIIALGGLLLPLWIHLLGHLLTFVFGGFISAIIVTKHEEKINRGCES